MKKILVITFIIFAHSFSLEENVCFKKATRMLSDVGDSFKVGSLDGMIDSLSNMFIQLPTLLNTCGNDQAGIILKKQIPPSCVKAVNKQAHLALKISRMMDNQPRNDKAIALYLALFETNYKMQVQKECPSVKTLNLNEVMNKASCMEAEYQYSLIVQKLDQDITKSHFNDSLNDFGKLIDKLPDTLDACNQKHLAELVRKNFPQECVTSLGLFVRELVEIEHHYTHLEWLKAHWRDFVHAIAELRSTCPALERRQVQ